MKTSTVEINPIKKAREAAGLTVRELAAAAGISKTTLSQIETGQSVPRADTLRTIANILKKTMDELWP